MFFVSVSMPTFFRFCFFHTRKRGRLLNHLLLSASLLSILSARAPVHTHKLKQVFNNSFFFVLHDFHSSFCCFLLFRVWWCLPYYQYYINIIIKFNGFRSGFFSLLYLDLLLMDFSSFFLWTHNGDFIWTQYWTHNIRARALNCCAHQCIVGVCMCVCVCGESKRKAAQLSRLG